AAGIGFPLVAMICHSVDPLLLKTGLSSTRFSRHDGDRLNHTHRSASQSPEPFLDVSLVTKATFTPGIVELGSAAGDLGRVLRHLHRGPVGVEEPALGKGDLVAR